MSFSMLRRVMKLATMMVAILSLVSCTEITTDGSLPIGTKSGINLGVAPELLARAVNPDQLRPEVTINGLAINAQRAANGSWSVTYTLFDSSLTINLLWIETYNGQDLVLASWSNSYNNITSDSRITIDASEYQTTLHDADADGVSNLAERTANTDPFSDSTTLQGDWLGECVVDEDGNGEQVVWSFNDANVKNLTFSSVQYIDTEVCVGENYVSVNLEGIAQITGEVSETASGTAQNLDITYINGSITAGALAIAALEFGGTSLEEISAEQGFDNIEFIPLADLMVDQPAVFTIYQISNGQLRLGVSSANRDGATAESRYTVLNTITYTRR